MYATLRIIMYSYKKKQKNFKGKKKINKIWIQNKVYHLHKVKYSDIWPDSKGGNK